MGDQEHGLVGKPVPFALHVARCAARRSAPTVRPSPPAVPTRHCGCGPLTPTQVGDVRQAHNQLEPPAVAGVGVAGHRLHQGLSGT